MNFDKVGCELGPSKEESNLRWMRPNAEHLANVGRECCSGQVRFPRAGRHLGCWLEVGGGVGTMMHQLLQICRLVEVQTCFLSDQEDSSPIFDQ